VKPLPKITPLTQPFWDGCRQGQLRLQQCDGCGDYRFFPSEACHACGNPGSRWQTVSRVAKVYSWIVVHRAVDPAWSGDVPFAIVVGAMDLPGRPLLTGTLLGRNYDLLAGGLEVTAEFEAVNPEISLLRWRLPPIRR